MGIRKDAELLEADHDGGNQRTEEEEKPLASTVANSCFISIYQIWNGHQSFLFTRQLRVVLLLTSVVSPNQNVLLNLLRWVSLAFYIVQCNVSSPLSLLKAWSDKIRSRQRSSHDLSIVAQRRHVALCMPPISSFAQLFNRMLLTSFQIPNSKPHTVSPLRPSHSLYHLAGHMCGCGDRPHCSARAQLESMAASSRCDIVSRTGGGEITA